MFSRPLCHQACPYFFISRCLVIHLNRKLHCSSRTSNMDNHTKRYRAMDVPENGYKIYRCSCGDEMLLWCEHLAGIF